MLSVSSRIWTRVTVSISYDDNQYTTGTSIREEFYCLSIRSVQFPEEQKSCQKRTRGTGGPLYIEEHIFKESKAKRKNVAMTWIYYNKS